RVYLAYLTVARETNEIAVVAAASGHDCDGLRLRRACARSLCASLCGSGALSVARSDSAAGAHLQHKIILKGNERGPGATAPDSAPRPTQHWAATCRAEAGAGRQVWKA